MKKPHGFTLVELLVVMAIIALLISLLLPALLKAKQKANLLKDQAQVKEIHKAWLTYAPEHNGLFPVPGLINRLPVQLPGQALRDIPGRGPEDVLQNTHDHLHSVVIMQNYYDPGLCVGPTEPNGNVFKFENYNWEVYNIIDDVYWDLNFQSELADLANVSYASMLIGGPARKDHWRNTMDSTFAIIGNRGVQAGRDDDAATYNNSTTLKIHGPAKQWEGNICFNDNHVEYLDTFWPEGILYEDRTDVDNTVSTADNLFSKQTPTFSSNQQSVFADGWDSFLCLSYLVFPVPGNPRFQLSWD